MHEKKSVEDIDIEKIWQLIDMLRISFQWKMINKYEQIWKSIISSEMHLLIIDNL